jgi:hypothetical protein
MPFDRVAADRWHPEDRAVRASRSRSVSELQRNLGLADAAQPNNGGVCEPAGAEQRLFEFAEQMLAADEATVSAERDVPARLDTRCFTT